jgi:hypothetical protein
MEFLKNFSKLANLNKKNENGFFNILLTRNAVQVCFWKKGSNDEVEISTISNFRHFDSFENCLLKADQCFQELGPESEQADRTVFSLDSTFLHNGDIKKDYKNLIKKLCVNLSLNAIGFIDDKEALIQKAIDEKEKQASSFLIEYVGHRMYCYFVSHGRLLFDFLADNESDLITKLKVNIDENHSLNKIVLFSAYLQKSVLLEKRQKLLKNFDLEEIQTNNLVFSFFTQADLLTVLTTEGGKAFFQNNTITTSTKDRQIDEFSSNNFDVSQEDLKSDSSEREERNSYEEEVEDKFDSYQDKIKKEKNFLSQNEEETSEANEKKPKFDVNESKNDDYSDSYLIEDSLTKKTQNKPQRRLKKKSFKIFFGWWQWSILGIFVFLIGGYFLLIYLSKAIISLTPQNKFLSTEKKITIDVEASEPDWDKLILPGKVVEETLDKTGEILVTGTTKVGEKAKGKITITNKDKNGDKNFDKATKVVCQDVEFILDSSVTVAAASVEKTDDGETISYSKVDVAVTANQIGETGNVEVNIKCKIADYSSSKYEATTLEKFTGGESKEVKIVAKKDKDDLLANIQKELLNQATDFFKAKSVAGEFYEFNGDFEIVDSEFDKKVGEQTENLNLNLSIKAKAIVYEAKDLKELAVKVLQKDLPENYKLAEGDPGFTSYVVKDSSESANLKENKNNSKEMPKLIYLEANISQKAEANLNFDELKNKLSNLSLLKAEELLKANQDIKLYQIEFKPFLAKYLGKIPKNKNNIVIKLNNNE